MYATAISADNRQVIGDRLRDDRIQADVVLKHEQAEMIRQFLASRPSLRHVTIDGADAAGRDGPLQFAAQLEISPGVTLPTIVVVPSNDIEMLVRFAKSAGVLGM